MDGVCIFDFVNFGSIEAKLKFVLDTFLPTGMVFFAGFNDVFEVNGSLSLQKILDMIDGFSYITVCDANRTYIMTAFGGSKYQ